ncbi:MAG: 8-amino-7-oxononanoate synthase [Cyanobacteria bacterium P01_H01_bin.121]
MSRDKFAFLDAALKQRRAVAGLRSLRPLKPRDAVQVWQGDRQLINFSHNDYLGLSKHPALIDAAQDYAERYGTGAAASRLVTGTYDIHAELEQQLAQTYNREAALLFNTGFQANLTLLAALMNQQALVLCDRLVHNSLLQGILASGARFIRYRHNDYPHLEQLLQQADQTCNLNATTTTATAANTDPVDKRIVIVSETIFSMDGDRADVDRLVALAQQYNAILYLDDAHAIGVLGAQGTGLAVGRTDVDLAVGTFGKAFGCFGAFVVCSQRLRDYFINFCAGLIYTTALPPPVIGAITAALALLPALDAERQQLATEATALRTTLQAHGYDTGRSDSQIIPLLLGSTERTLAAAQQLETGWDLLVTPIRPPTVPQGSARLRLALSSAHQPQQLERLQQALLSLT